jgi:type IV secretory pathway TraG/TraD family ATPase VirD4
MAPYLKIFKNLEDTKNGFAILPFMAQITTKQWLFLSCPPHAREFLKPIFSTFLSLVIKGLMMRQENNNQKTWIIIDELASMHKIPSLITGLSESRKYGGCFVIGFQDLSQLDEIYGQSVTKTISNLTSTKILFRTQDTDIAARVARYLGEQEKQEAQTSISYGAHQMRDGVNLNHHKQTKQLVKASDIMMLDDLNAYLKVPGSFPISQIKFDYKNLPYKNPVFIKKILDDDNLNLSANDFKENVHGQNCVDLKSAPFVDSNHLSNFGKSAEICNQTGVYKVLKQDQIVP